MPVAVPSAAERGGDGLKPLVPSRFRIREIVGQCIGAEAGTGWHPPAGINEPFALRFRWLARVSVRRRAPVPSVLFLKRAGGFTVAGDPIFPQLPVELV